MLIYVTAAFHIITTLIDTGMDGLSCETILFMTASICLLWFTL